MKNTIKCNRCNLNYPQNQDNCTYCQDLTDEEVNDINYQFKQEHNLNIDLGKKLIGWSLKYRKYSHEYNKRQQLLNPYRLAMIAFCIVLLIVIQFLE